MSWSLNVGYANNKGFTVYCMYDHYFVSIYYSVDLFIMKWFCSNSEVHSVHTLLEISRYSQ